MSSLKDQCRELLAAKQDLIDKARTLLVGNRTLLQRLQASTGIRVTSDADDPAYVSFNQVQGSRFKVRLVAFSIWCFKTLHHLPASNQN
ncbi:hypothetical protein Pfo_025034 [Paulownia fortunei]|nr:hypothetical protein Pfo_025034 [Paulownia fortunei]